MNESDDWSYVKLWGQGPSIHNENNFQQPFWAMHWRVVHHMWGNITVGAMKLAIRQEV